MEVVYLILGFTLTLFAYFLGFDIPTSSFILFGNVFYYSCFRCFFFLNGLIIFCGLQKYWCKLYIIRHHSFRNALKCVHQ